MKILSWHFPLGFCQKGGLCLHKCIKESSVLLWFIRVSSLQHPPSYRPFLEDVTRLKTLSWPILCRLPLARSSVIELSWSFSYFSISTPKEMIICFWDQWSCLRVVYGAEGCCCCWSICGGLVPVACWPKECVWEPDGAVNHPDSSKPSMLGPSAGLSSQSSFSPTFSPLTPSLLQPLSSWRQALYGPRPQMWDSLSAFQASERLWKVLSYRSASLPSHSVEYFKVISFKFVNRNLNHITVYKNSSKRDSLM